MSLTNWASSSGSAPRVISMATPVLMVLLVMVAVLGACGGSGPTGPSGRRFQVEFSSQAPDRCTGPCLKLAWIDQGAATQGQLKLAVQVQNIPPRGISSASNILSGRTSGTFSQSSASLVFSTSTAGDFFERLGKSVRYEVSDVGMSLSNCCLTTYAVGFPTPAPADRVSGDGTIVVLVYRLREPGSIELDPGIGLLGDVFVTSYSAQLRVTVS
jgi:hypothetical protein